MTRTLTRLGLLTLAFGLGTWALGWWAVPAIGLLWGLMAASAPRTPIRAGAAALISWLLLLVVPAMFGAPIFGFGADLAAAMTVPVWALWLAEFVFPFAAGWSAAAVGSALRGDTTPAEPAGQ